MSLSDSLWFLRNHPVYPYLGVHSVLPLVFMRTRVSPRRNASKDYKAREIFSGHGRHNSASVARFIPPRPLRGGRSSFSLSLRPVGAEPPASVRTMDRSRNMDAHLSRVMLMRPVDVSISAAGKR